MGGRGASAGSGGSGGGGGGGGSAANLTQQILNGQLSMNLSQQQQQNDYTDNNNPNLLKYQQQTDDKTAAFLSSTDKNVDLNDPQYADGYSYHDLPLNKLLLNMGITQGPTVLSDKDFNKYVKQTGAQVVYRGWSGDPAVQRFMNATHNHVGNGVMGDGYYFTPSKSTAQTYGPVVTKMALSPTARVVDLQTVRNALANASPKLRSSMRKTGTMGSGRTYGANSGEAQMALKMGYNVIQSGSYLVAITADAFVVSKKKG